MSEKQAEEEMRFEGKMITVGGGVTFLGMTIAFFHPFGWIVFFFGMFVFATFVYLYNLSHEYLDKF